MFVLHNHCDYQQIFTDCPPSLKLSAWVVGSLPSGRRGSGVTGECKTELQEEEADTVQTVPLNRALVVTKDAHASPFALSFLTWNVHEKCH